MEACAVDVEVGEGSDGGRVGGGARKSGCVGGDVMFVVRVSESGGGELAGRLRVGDDR